MKTLSNLHRNKNELRQQLLAGFLQLKKGSKQKQKSSIGKKQRSKSKEKIKSRQKSSKIKQNQAQSNFPNSKVQQKQNIEISDIKISPYEFKYKKNNNLLIDYDRTRLEEELVGSFLEGNQNSSAINNISKVNKIVQQYNKNSNVIQKLDFKDISIGKNLQKYDNISSQLTKNQQKRQKIRTKSDITINRVQHKQVSLLPNHHKNVLQLSNYVPDVDSISKQKQNQRYYKYIKDDKASENNKARAYVFSTIPIDKPQQQKQYQFSKYWNKVNKNKNNDKPYYDYKFSKYFQNSNNDHHQTIIKTHYNNLMQQQLSQKQRQRRNSKQWSIGENSKINQNNRNNYLNLNNTNSIRNNNHYYNNQLHVHNTNDNNRPSNYQLQQFLSSNQSHSYYQQQRLPQMNNNNIDENNNRISHNNRQSIEQYEYSHTNNSSFMNNLNNNNKRNSRNSRISQQSNVLLMEFKREMNRSPKSYQNHYHSRSVSKGKSQQNQERSRNKNGKKSSKEKVEKANVIKIIPKGLKNKSEVHNKGFQQKPTYFKSESNSKEGIKIIKTDPRQDKMKFYSRLQRQQQQQKKSSQQSMLSQRTDHNFDHIFGDWEKKQENFRVQKNVQNKQLEHFNHIYHNNNNNHHALSQKNNKNSSLQKHTKQNLINNPSRIRSQNEKSIKITIEGQQRQRRRSKTSSFLGEHKHKRQKGQDFSSNLSEEQFDFNSYDNEGKEYHKHKISHGNNVKIVQIQKGAKDKQHQQQISPQNQEKKLWQNQIASLFKKKQTKKSFYEQIKSIDSKSNKKTEKKYYQNITPYRADLEIIDYVSRIKSPQAELSSQKKQQSNASNNKISNKSKQQSIKSNQRQYPSSQKNNQNGFIESQHQNFSQSQEFNQLSTIKKPQYLHGQQFDLSPSPSMAKEIRRDSMMNSINSLNLDQEDKNIQQNNKVYDNNKKPYLEDILSKSIMNYKQLQRKKEEYERQYNKKSSIRSYEQSPKQNQQTNNKQSRINSNFIKSPSSKQSKQSSLFSMKKGHQIVVKTKKDSQNDLKNKQQKNKDNQQQLNKKMNQVQMGSQQQKQRRQQLQLAGFKKEIDYQKDNNNRKQQQQQVIEQQNFQSERQIEPLGKNDQELISVKQEKSKVQIKRQVKKQQQQQKKQQQLLEQKQNNQKNEQNIITNSLDEFESQFNKKNSSLTINKPTDNNNDNIIHQTQSQSQQSQQKTITYKQLSDFSQSQQQQQSFNHNHDSNKQQQKHKQQQIKNNNDNINNKIISNQTQQKEAVQNDDDDYLENNNKNVYKNDNKKKRVQPILQVKKNKQYQDMNKNGIVYQNGDNRNDNNNNKLLLEIQQKKQENNIIRDKETNKFDSIDNHDNNNNKKILESYSTITNNNITINNNQSIINSSQTNPNNNNNKNKKQILINFYQMQDGHELQKLLLTEKQGFGQDDKDQQYVGLEMFGDWNCAKNMDDNRNFNQVIRDRIRIRENQEKMRRNNNNNNDKEGYDIITNQQDMYKNQQNIIQQNENPMDKINTTTNLTNTNNLNQTPNKQSPLPNKPNTFQQPQITISKPPKQQSARSSSIYSDNNPNKKVRLLESIQLSESQEQQSSEQEDGGQGKQNVISNKAVTNSTNNTKLFNNNYSSYNNKKPLQKIQQRQQQLQGTHKSIVQTSNKDNTRNKTYKKNYNNQIQSGVKRQQNLDESYEYVATAFKEKEEGKGGKMDRGDMEGRRLFDKDESHSNSNSNSKVQQQKQKKQPQQQQPQLNQQSGQHQSLSSLTLSSINQTELQNNQITNQDNQNQQVRQASTTSNHKKDKIFKNIEINLQDLVSYQSSSDQQQSPSKSSSKRSYESSSGSNRSKGLAIKKQSQIKPKTLAKQPLKNQHNQNTTINTQQQQNHPPLVPLPLAHSNANANATNNNDLFNINQQQFQSQQSLSKIYYNRNKFATNNKKDNEKMKNQQQQVSHHHQELSDFSNESSVINHSKTQKIKEQNNGDKIQNDIKKEKERSPQNNGNKKVIIKLKKSNKGDKSDKELGKIQTIDIKVPEFHQQYEKHIDRHRDSNSNSNSSDIDLSDIKIDSIQTHQIKPYQPNKNNISYYQQLSKKSDSNHINSNSQLSTKPSVKQTNTAVNNNNNIKQSQQQIQESSKIQQQRKYINQIKSRVNMLKKKISKEEKVQVKEVLEGDNNKNAKIVNDAKNDGRNDNISNKNKISVKRIELNGNNNNKDNNTKQNITQQTTKNIKIKKSPFLKQDLDEESSQENSFFDTYLKNPVNKNDFENKYPTKNETKQFKKQLSQPKDSSSLQIKPLQSSQTSVESGYYQQFQEFTKLQPKQSEVEVYDQNKAINNKIGEQIRNKYKLTGVGDNKVDEVIVDKKDEQRSQDYPRIAKSPFFDWSEDEKMSSSQQVVPKRQQKQVNLQSSHSSIQNTIIQPIVQVQPVIFKPQNYYLASTPKYQIKDFQKYFTSKMDKNQTNKSSSNKNISSKDLESKNNTKNKSIQLSKKSSQMQGSSGIVSQESNNFNIISNKHKIVQMESQQQSKHELSSFSDSINSQQSQSNNNNNINKPNNNNSTTIIKPTTKKGISIIMK